MVNTSVKLKFIVLNSFGSKIPLHEDSADKWDKMCIYEVEPALVAFET